jgi:hypothetical protein
MELSLAKTAKGSKKLSLSQMMITELSFCSMVGVASTMSSLSSSSDSSVSESAQTPWPNPDTAISSTMVVAGSELSSIPEMAKLETTRSDMEREGTGLNAPHRADGFDGMFLN